MPRRVVLGSFLLLLAIVATGSGLAAWKLNAIRAEEAASANQPEPMESVTVAVAREIEHRRTTTSIGTVVALRSITLRNEVPGTVHEVALVPGQVVEAGTVLVAFDVSVEQAELEARKAQAALADSLLGRVQHARQSRAVSESEVDRALAERDVARAEIARIGAIIDRKTIRAPFRARVGIADLHPGQYLEEGTPITTLQGVDASAYVDFTVAQAVASGLREGATVEIYTEGNPEPTPAAIVALDSRVDPSTRNTTVRARIPNRDGGPAPGASVRVRVPAGQARPAVTVPASALRKGPEGDQVYVITQDESGRARAHSRRVESGTALGEEVVIEAGLVAGERVAASGSFKLRESALVAIAGDQEQAP